MAAEHQVDAAGFEDGHDVRAHLDELPLAVAVVRALGVRRMVEVGDDPVGLGPFQVHLQPAGHDAGGFAIHIVRIQADEMDPPIVKRVVRLRPRRQTARLAARRQHISVVVRADAVGPLGSGALVVAHRRPTDRVAQRRFVGLEEARLELRVAPAGVRHVAQMEIKVERPPFPGDEIGHRTVDVVFGLAAGARIAHDPEAHRLGLALHRMGREMVARVQRGQPVVPIQNRVEVAGVRHQPEQVRLVLVKPDGRAVQSGQAKGRRVGGEQLRQLRLVRRERDAGDDGRRADRVVQPSRQPAELHDRVDGPFRPPRDDDGSRRGQLQIGRAGEVLVVTLWQRVTGTAAGGLDARRQAARQTQRQRLE